MEKEASMPGDLVKFIQAGVDRLREDKEMMERTKRNLAQKKELVEITEKEQKSIKVRAAKANLKFINEFIQEEPFRSFLKLIGWFPLMENSTAFHLYLKEDGVYAGGRSSSSSSTTIPVPRSGETKVTSAVLESIEKDEYDDPLLMLSLAEWDKKRIIEYLLQYFSAFREGIE